MAGDRASAKKFSTLGRQQEKEMFELHQKAAEEIFRQRNRLLPNPLKDTNTNETYSTKDQEIKNKESPPLLDLHGLHVTEALEMVTKSLSSKEFQNHSALYILCGTGHHSSAKHNRGKVRLLPAIEKWLQDHEITYSDASSDKRKGLLCVNLQASRESLTHLTTT